MLHAHIKIHKIKWAIRPKAQIGKKVSVHYQKIAKIKELILT
jgi:hypothetical protein